MVLSGANRDTESPDWNDFKMLLAVAQFGSIRGAASALSLAHLTVSRRIERLENAVHKRLIERSSSGAKLTKEGRNIVNKLTLARGAIQRAVRSTAARRADVKVLMADGLASCWLPRHLPNFFERHSSVQLRIFTSPQLRAERDADFDVTVQSSRASDREFDAEKLGVLHFMPYASRDYLLQFGVPGTAADLTHHRLLDSVSSTLDKGKWSTRMSGKLDEGSPILFTNLSRLLYEAVRSGCGIAFLPTCISVCDEDIVPIDIGMRLESPIWLCYRRQRLRKQEMRIATGFFRSIFDGNALPWFAERFMLPRAFASCIAENGMDGHECRSDVG